MRTGRGWMCAAVSAACAAASPSSYGFKAPCIATYPSSAPASLTGVLAAARASITGAPECVVSELPSPDTPRHVLAFGFECVA